MTNTATLETIYAAAATTEAGTGMLVEDPNWIDALLRMAPSPEPVRRGEHWLQQHCELLEGGRHLMANVSRDADGVLRVTAHTNPSDAGAEWRRLRQDILGRPSGVTVRHMNALDLIGRVAVSDENDLSCMISGLQLDTASGRIMIKLLVLDEDGDTEISVLTLDGWSVD